MRTVGKPFKSNYFRKLEKHNNFLISHFRESARNFSDLFTNNLFAHFLESIHSKSFNADGFVFNEVVQIDTFNHYRLEFIALTSIKRWIFESKLCNSIKPTNLAVAGEKLFVNILSLCVFYFSFSHHFSINIKIHEFTTTFMICVKFFLNH